MNSNSIILLIISVISLYLIREKFNKIVIIIIISSLLVGIAVTKNVAISFFIACIIGSISTLFLEDIETFKTKKKTTEKDKPFKINKGKSFYENYKSLTKKQVEGLSTDTKELLTIQKNLIETLNNMGPALSNSKEILNTFKNYFKNEKNLKA